MTTDPAPSAPFEVLIAGGGVAALEAALALRDLAADRISLKLIAANPEFVYRPASVNEPFSFGGARHYPLDEIAADIGIELIEDSLESVDPAGNAALTASGARHDYDALLLALGARISPRYEHATTIDDRRLDQLLHGLIQDLEGGYVKRLAFVVPPRMAWPLPIYELALMSAQRAYDMNVEVAITVLTPEDAPLAVFGGGASEALSALLADSGIEVVTSAYCEIPRAGQIEVSPGGRTVGADRVVALPELDGPAVPGLPQAENGFIPVDLHNRVRGLEHEYAAGDATDFAVKHGGIAAHQADIAAQSIAAAAGAPVQPEEFHPSIRGVLLTGAKPRFLSAKITGGHGFTSEMSEQASWSPAAKISAKYLAPYLEERDRAAGRSGSQ
jgi:sulfide:quinone oxidoreductase